MKHFARPHEQLWIYSMGKRFRVRAMFTDDLAANAFMARNRDTGAIAAFGAFVIVANLYEGVKPQDSMEFTGDLSGCCMYHQSGGNRAMSCANVECVPVSDLTKQQIIEQHKERDSWRGVDWNSPDGCGCLTCRESRGWL